MEWDEKIPLGRQDLQDLRRFNKVAHQPIILPGSRQKLASRQNDWKKLSSRLILRVNKLPQL
jgi:hypothetical protein